MTTIPELARETSSYFERYERAQDDVIWTIRDDAPEWVRDDFIQTAHGTDIFPDDWRYESIVSALDRIGELDDDAPEYELDEAGTEWADGNVDVYTGRRLQWLASHLSRPGYVDEGVAELGGDELDTTERIGLGQYMESREIFGNVLEALRDRLAELDDEDDDDDEDAA